MKRVRVTSRTESGVVWASSLPEDASEELLRALDALAEAAAKMARQKRVRVEGDLYHGRVPEGAVYVGRAAPGLPASPFANPFKIEVHGVAARKAALDLFARYLDEHPELVERARVELAGKDLACWCRLADPCHADILLQRLAV